MIANNPPPCVLDATAVTLNFVLTAALAAVCWFWGWATGRGLMMKNREGKQ